MSVTVVIVNWNAGPLLARCLECLVRQTSAPQGVIVIDNASTDGSLNRLPAVPGLLVACMGSNLGFAAGNNRALSMCETEFVALLNPDAFPEPTWLENLLAAAARHPGTAAFGSLQLTDADDRVIDDIGDAYHLSGYVWQEAHGAKLRPEHLEPREIFSPCAAAALYRKDALDEVGGFDEDFFCYMEDSDLGFRLRLAGHAARSVPDAVVRHVGSATSGGRRNDFAVYHGHRNLVWAFVRNMPGPLLWLFAPAHLLLTGVVMVRFALKRQLRVWLRAKRDAVRGLPRAWAKRRQTQATRKASAGDIWRALDKRLIPGPRA
ncbi:MAG: glycosyltransferase family 2 protein [Burkholderiaceae bacterium]